MDGGVSRSVAAEVAAAGGEVLVVGSALWRAEGGPSAEIAAIHAAVRHVGRGR